MNKEVKHKTALCVVLCALAILLGGCTTRFYRKTPYDYPDSIWVSKDPYIYLHVVDQYSYNAESYIIINGERIPVVFFAEKKSATCYIVTSKPDGDSESLLIMEYECFSDRIELKVLHDYCFDGQYDSIVMYRNQS